MPEPQQTGQDQQQFTNVALDAPNRSTITQPVDNARSSGQIPQSSVQLPPVVAPPFMPPLDYDNAEPADAVKPDELKEQLHTVKNGQQEAKQKAQAALQQVKEIEEQAKESETKLAQQAKEAEEQAHQAQNQIDKATEQQREVQKALKQASPASGPRVAGYKPFDLLKALNSPPRPGASKPSEAAFDSEAQKELSRELKETQQETKRSNSTVSAANQQVSKARQAVQKSRSQHANILQKVSRLLDSAAEQATAADSQSYKAFMIIGAVCLGVALLSVPFTGSFVWVVFMLVALVQLGMGTMLKKKSQ